MAFPPDTDTPGFVAENRDKPEETRLISESAGLFTPNQVAKALLNDSLVRLLFLCFLVLSNLLLIFLER